jgi:tetratricopeptide (TPR) repeat protein
LDQQIRIENPTDGMHPYYFWNCTAFPNRPGTRFIYPMSLGTDHNAREFFNWPVHEGRDLSWLKNYETYASVFAVECPYDFFGAYDADADRGIVQVANHHELGGKKAWTWGEWEFGKVAQKNLTDTDGPYIEVQSGPLPTQSDYGMLEPRGRVAWREYWYPVHGLGDGFEFANENLAVQTAMVGRQLEFRLLATGKYNRAECVLAADGQTLVRQTVDLSPAAPTIVTLARPPLQPLDVTVTSGEGRLLAAFITPLPIPGTDQPTPPRFADLPDDPLSVEELYLKGRKFDRATDRRQARAYYERALTRDAGHVDSLQALAVLDFESGLYEEAIGRSGLALDRDSDAGLCWYYRGVGHLRLGHFADALRCGYRAARCFGTAAIGYDLAGRAALRLGDHRGAVDAFTRAVRADGNDSRAADHLLLARYAAGAAEAKDTARARVREHPTAVVPATLVWLCEGGTPADLGRSLRSFLGEPEFELLEASLVFAELGLFQEASRIVQAGCVDAAPTADRSCLPFYYLAWYASRCGDAEAAQPWLVQASQTRKERAFASRPEEVEILRYAAAQNPRDAQAQLQLGCLLAHLGRVDEATAAWQKAAELDPQQSISWRNLGLAAAAKDDLPAAEGHYRRALAARPGDQTLYRDLAEILTAAGRRADAIGLLEDMPIAGMRRAEITVMLAEAYVALQRYEDCIQLLSATPYFVNWEGQDVTWRLFNRSHIERGRQRLQQGDAAAALADFEAALTYPANLNVGRSNKPQEAPAQYWRGQALAALDRLQEAREAWQTGADGADVRGEQNEYREKCRKALADG